MSFKENLQLEWKLKEFDDLLPREVYSIMQLREEIFIVEQNTVCNDMDSKDLACAHLMCYNLMNNNELVACARLKPPGVSYDGFSSIGRVVNKKKFRGLGIGKELLTRSVDEIQKKFPGIPIRISGQLYLKKFYERFGFEQTSDVYLEDSIDHIQLTKYF
jgi:ElaA protein